MISVEQQSWTGIENVMNKEGDCACLCISYSHQIAFLWILKKSSAISLRQIKVDEKTLHTRLEEFARNLDEFFAITANSFKRFSNLTEELREDRSLNDVQSRLDSSQEGNLETLRRGKSNFVLRNAHQSCFRLT